LTLSQTAFHICSLDCSTILPASCQMVIGRLAAASRWPCASKTPARALPVPTSMPMK